MVVRPTCSDRPAEAKKLWHAPQLEILGGIEKETKSGSNLGSDGNGVSSHS
jgi:hypothetical protein